MRSGLAARVQTSLTHPPVHRFTAYGLGLELPPTPDEYARRAVTLPLFSISEEQIGRRGRFLRRGIDRFFRN